MSSRTKVIVGVLGALIVLGLVYVEFFSNPSTNGVTTTGGTPSADAQKFLDLTTELGPISFDTSILNDPRFTSLVDIHTAIIPEQSGRRDPFAPTSGSSVSTNSSGSSSQSQ